MGGMRSPFTGFPGENGKGAFHFNGNIVKWIHQATPSGIYCPEVEKMAGYVVFGALAAFGLLSLLWTMLGWLLPSGKGCAVVCFGCPDEGIRARYRWLKGMGFFAGPLIAVTEEEITRQACCETEICSPGELLARLEWERNRFDGTGNGDPSGCHQRRGVSEL